MLIPVVNCVHNKPIYSAATKIPERRQDNLGIRIENKEKIFLCFSPLYLYAITENFKHNSTFQFVNELSFNSFSVIVGTENILTCFNLY